MSSRGIYISFFLFISLAVLTSGCDQGFSPPEENSPGAIAGIISYSGRWPPADSLRDLRFVAMRFIPADTSDFLQLNKMAISSRLDFNVATDSFLIDNVLPGPFFYSGVAQQFSGNLLSWRPVGLYEENGGIFLVRPGITVNLDIQVNFGKIPVFPPDVP